MQDIFLILENGIKFKGKSFGAKGEITGEVVFTTGMTGYLETLTDPSYFGQIVVQTFPLIGNYGVIPTDFESTKPNLRGYIVKELCQEPSNFRCEGLLDTFLSDNGIIGICGIDTRALTKIVREYGVMNGKISLTDADDAEISKFNVVQAVASVSPKEETFTKSAHSKRKVVLWDFGAKENIKRELLKRDCDVITVPYNTTAKRIMELSPDGVMLSNGPGDPAENVGIIEQLTILKDYNIPTFGICLGHQLLALANGAKTEKLKYGHRGANQPVTDTATGRIYVTSQNHGYTVVKDSLKDNSKLSFVNSNDDTCEGVDYLDYKAFTVQFHPEACGGPLDTAFLFDKFIGLMEGDCYATK
jgi:carbamoyl-phosphate synthase small subunit